MVKANIHFQILSNELTGKTTKGLSIEKLNHRKISSNRGFN